MSYNTVFKGQLYLEYNKKTSKAERKRIQKRVKDLEINWVVENDQLKWNGALFSTNYLKHLKDILDDIFTPEGVTANGIIKWLGEDMGDSGTIIVTSNHLTFKGERKHAL